MVTMGWQLEAVETPVEVRRAVRLTVKLGEPAATGAGQGSRVEGSWGGVTPGAGAEEAGGVVVRRPLVAGETAGERSEGAGRLGGEESDGSAADFVFDDGDGVSPAVRLEDAAQTDLKAAKRVVLSLETGVLYDDNIFLNGRDPVADVLWRASAEARLNLGDAVAREDSHVVARYRPDAYFFQDNTDENTVDHEAALTVRKKFAKLAVDVAGTYQRTSGSTVELGDRVPRDVVVARAGLVYAVGAKTSVSTGVRWDATAYREGAYADYREWAHESFADYQATEKFRLGLGGGYGRLEVDDGSAPQDFQRALMRTTYAATGKLSLAGRAGVEFRRTEVRDSATPVFGLELTHQLTGKTAARLQGLQEVAASGALEGRNYVRTGLSAGLTHRLNERLALSLDGGWEQYDYEAARRSAEDLGDRRDSNVFVRPGFSYSFGERWKAEAWYQWRSADSTDPDQVYEVNQAGFNLRCEF